LKKLMGSDFSPLMENRYFMLIHNILSVRGHLGDLALVADGACTHSGAREDMAHFLLRCQRVAD
jgi:hypothetical protein